MDSTRRSLLTFITAALSGALHAGCASPPSAKADRGITPEATVEITAEVTAEATVEVTAKPTTRPNILFILADDVRPDAIGALGGDAASTEHLDALVARGTAFVNTVHMGSPHGAICVGSRAMIMTGRNLWTRGPDNCSEYPLWGEVFAAAGYATFGTGKWHNGEESFARSFEIEGAHAGGFLPSTDQKGDAYQRPPADGAPDTWSAGDTTRQGHWLTVGDRVVHSSERWTNEAVAFLEQHARSGPSRPFFAFVSYHAPHDPRQAPQAYLDTRPVDSIRLAPNAMAVHPFDQGDARVRDEMLAPFPRSDFALRTHEREYRAIFEHLDDEIGILLERLATLGLADDTIVVFAGDHGLAVSRHGLLGKQSLYEHSVRTPFVIAGPGVANGRRVDETVYLHSAIATAADLAGVAPPDTMEPEAGSVARLARDDSAQASTDAAPFPTIYSAYGKELQRMVRDGRWKLIVYPKARVIQLFDLAGDPWELDNLADDPAHAGTVARLHRELIAWMTRVKDPLAIERIADACAWPAPKFDAARP